MNKTIILGIIILTLMPLVSSQTYSQNSDIIISHPIRINGGIDGSISANISIKNPDGEFIINSNAMIYNNSIQEHQFLLDGGNTSEVGIYPYCITATGSGYNNTVCYDDLEITPSGFSRISPGESLILIAGLIIIFSIAIFSFILFYKSESFTGKITFVSIAGIFTLISVLFGAIMLQQNLAGFTNVITGYETFVFITKMVVTVAFLAFGITILLFMTKAWRLRRGID